MIYRDNRGRFISKDSITLKILRAHFILREVVRQEMLTGFTYSITKHPELLLDLRDIRSFGKKIAREIREIRFKHKIFETF